MKRSNLVLHGGRCDCVRMVIVRCWDCGVEEGENAPWTASDEPSTHLQSYYAHESVTWVRSTTASATASVVQGPPAIPKALWSGFVQSGLCGGRRAIPRSCASDTRAVFTPVFHSAA